MDHFAIFNWKGCFEASYIPRMSTSIISYSLSITSVPAQHQQSSEWLQKRQCFSREGPALFSVSFLGFLEKNETCTCWFLKSSLTRRVWVTPNMWTGCSCSHISWGASHLEGNTGFHRCSTWLSLKKDSEHFCPLFMLGNPTVCRVFRCGS